MRNIHEVIIRPVMTEKSTDQLDKHNAYTFVVDVDANKLEIARAVETLFKVKVKNVRTMQYRGKERRVGRHSGRRAAWKKAVVTLREGPIELFVGV